jgi:hypothetical protein
MAELAKAYVQIIPSARGMTDGIKNELSGAGGAGGASAGAKFWTFFKKALPIAAIGKLVKDTLDVGAAYEQASGGIKKIFGDDAAKVVMENAHKAWSTAGMSAGDYAERVTGISAALKRTTGDAFEAAAVADVAMRSMADNWATFNTPMETISRAYMNFARDQYMMLDSLNLGYAGTRTGMQQLLEDAEKITGVEYEIGNLADMIQAIEVIQKDLGIAGTAALETKTTFSGAFGAMTAAVKNFMTALFMGDGLAQSMADMVESVTTFGGILWERLLLVFDGLATALPELIPGLISNLAGALSAGIPAIASAGAKLLTGIVRNLPEIITAIIAAISEIIIALAEGILAFVGEMAALGVELISALISGITGKKGDVEGEGSAIINALSQSLSEGWARLKAAGREIVAQIIAGIAEAWGELVGWFKGLVDDLFGNVNVNVNVVGRYLGGTGASAGAGGSLIGGRKFKTGLEYVPYDDFPALLHRGERVLTAQEAADYNRGGMNNAVVDLLQGILVAVSSREETTVTLNIDKRELGRAVLAVV